MTTNKCYQDVKYNFKKIMVKFGNVFNNYSIAEAIKRINQI